MASLKKKILKQAVKILSDNPDTMTTVGDAAADSKDAMDFTQNAAETGSDIVDAYALLKSAYDASKRIRSVPAPVSNAPKMIVHLTPSQALDLTKTPVQKAATGLQTALWGFDAGRTAVDSEYRQRAVDAQKELMAEGGIGSMGKAVLSAIERPTSSLAGIVEGVGDAYVQLKNAEGELDIERQKKFLDNRRQLLKAKRQEPIPENMDDIALKSAMSKLS